MNFLGGSHGSMSTSGGSNLELVGPGEAVGGRAVSANTAVAGGVTNSSPYIRLSSLTHHQVLQQQQHQQQHSQHHSIYQKVVDPSTLQSNKGSFLNKSTNNPDESCSSSAATPVIKDTPTYEIHDNEPYVVTVRSSPSRSLVKSVSGSSVPSAPAGLKVFSGVSKAGPRLALYRSNSSLDLLDRDNYLNNQARAFHHSHAHQLSPQQRLNLVAQSQVHAATGVGVSTGCFTRRKDFGSHGSIDVLSAQNASLIHGGGGHTTRSGSVGGSTTRPFLSLMNQSSGGLLVHNNKGGTVEQVDGGGSGNGIIEESKSLPVVGEASDGMTTKVVLRHGTNPMEERYRRRALAHYDCQSISANISYAARLRSLLSKRRNTTTGASAASLGQRSPPESNGNNASSSTINGGLSPSSGGPSLSSLAQSSSQNASSSSSSGNLLQVPDHQDSDLGDGKSNALVLSFCLAYIHFGFNIQLFNACTLHTLRNQNNSCPYFRNETGGEQERIVSLTKLSRTAANKPATGYRKVGIYGKADDVDVMGKGPFVAPSDEATHRSVSCRNLALLEWRNGATHWQHGICPYAINVQATKQNILEAVDVGATYYREYFNKQDHENWFGLDENLGPLAFSIKKERFDNQLYSNLNHHEGKSGIVASSGPKCLFRVIIRSTELNTIRGSVLDESIPGIKPNSNKGGTHAKDVLEFLLPEVQLSCLKLGTSGPQTEDLLLKLDEQVLTYRHKVGIMYCKAGQSTEEEMYNNESAGPAFNEFLDLIGNRIRLKGFDKYTGGLDNKDDSTGLHSIYSQYQGCEVIFHVSTLLPFTPNNRQQLMRKRHIGNDIVTIVFQEPGALPFTPKNIRSHFQHVFIVVRAINPCTDSTSYSVSVSRSREVPLFGPPIPAGAKFPKNQDFVDFLMAKVINAETATYRSEKFTTMATRTRQEYLKDLVSNFTTSTPIDPRSKFSLMAFGASKKKDFSKPLRFIGDTMLQGALSWAVYLEDTFKGCRIDAFLGISCDTIVIIDALTREAVFAIACSSLSVSSIYSLRLYYHQGECVTIYGKETSSISEGDLQEIVNRLEIVTKGCETQEFVLHRNEVGQLGFHVQQDGVITEIESSGHAASVGLKQGSRLVEVCNVVVATLTQDQMIEWLKKSTSVPVLVIPPNLNNTPRRYVPEYAFDEDIKQGCDSKHCVFTLEPEGEYENIHLKNGVREDGESSYSKSPHSHYKSNAVNSHRKRYEPRSFSPPRSSNSSGYGTGSSSKSFSSGNGDTHHVSPHHEFSNILGNVDGKFSWA
ncbi:Signal-induced proliferation-associated 1-like protein 1 [Orchesella cincta]|uniref:Signal-induced proliferation-associated 1-like protein 1 n=1 Tax=Orchesella cincta TaxID=48709 RepID=A0A1D2NK69_ORCCI|nr:Signal-induced proliferation-associated 1-like protein 1 [Orchesella cincta]